MKAVFITGTDTDVGKTFVSAAFTYAWNSNYWKPMQTGSISDPGDTPTVQKLTGFSSERFAPPQVSLAYPLSPWRAFIKEGIEPVQVKDIAIPGKFLDSERPLIIEGAGGLFVPINEAEIMTDLIKHFNVPVILVARSGLGTINHTMLSIDHLRNRGVSNIYIVLNGPPNPDNAETLEKISGVKVISTVPWSEQGIESVVQYIPNLEEIDFGSN